MGFYPLTVTFSYILWSICFLLWGGKTGLKHRSRNLIHWKVLFLIWRFQFICFFFSIFDKLHWGKHVLIKGVNGLWKKSHGDIPSRETGVWTLWFPGPGSRAPACNISAGWHPPQSSQPSGFLMCFFFFRGNKYNTHRFHLYYYQTHVNNLISL